MGGTSPPSSFNVGLKIAIFYQLGNLAASTPPENYAVHVVKTVGYVVAAKTTRQPR